MTQPIQVEEGWRVTIDETDYTVMGVSRIVSAPVDPSLPAMATKFATIQRRSGTASNTGSWVRVAVNVPCTPPDAVTLSQSGEAQMGIPYKQHQAVLVDYSSSTLFDVLLQKVTQRNA